MVKKRERVGELIVSDAGDLLTGTLGAFFFVSSVGTVRTTMQVRGSGSRRNSHVFVFPISKLYRVVPAHRLA
jgi:hypothetical protein